MLSTVKPLENTCATGNYISLPVDRKNFMEHLLTVMETKSNVMEHLSSVVEDYTTVMEHLFVVMETKTTVMENLLTVMEYLSGDLEPKSTEGGSQTSCHGRFIK